MKITGDLASHSFPDRRRVTGPDRLGPIGRLLLTSDGTVTVMLEQIVGEKIVTALLDQSMAPVDRETAALMCFPVTGLVTPTTNLEPRGQYLVFIAGIPAFLIEESFTPSCVEFCTAGMPAAQQER